MLVLILKYLTGSGWFLSNLDIFIFSSTRLYYYFVLIILSFVFSVLKALTRKFKLHEDVSLYDVAAKCLPNFTGADMYALCADAWFTAAKRKVAQWKLQVYFN